MRVPRRALCASLLVLAGCRRAAPQSSPEAGAAPPSSTVVVLDAGLGEPRWSCVTSPAETVTLPRDASLGAIAFGSEKGSPPLVAYAGEVDGVRRHAAVRLRADAAVVRGPTAVGDAPPWTPFLRGGEEGFVRLVTGAKASWVLQEGAVEALTSPIELGDELAIDALAVGRAVVVASTVADGVEVRVIEGGRVQRGFRIEGGESPMIVRREDGSFAVAARVEAPLDAAKPVRDVPTAALEGAGQERTAATLVVVDATGKRLASHALAAGEDVIGLSPSRARVFLAARRVLKGQSVVDLARVGGDGKRVAVGEFPRRRGGRLVPIEVEGEGSEAEALEVTSDGAAVLGARPGTLPLGEVDVVLMARAVEDRLEVFAVRDTASTPQVFRSVCRSEIR